jgi:hypothetical protein
VVDREFAQLKTSNNWPASSFNLNPLDFWRKEKDNEHEKHEFGLIQGYVDQDLSGNVSDYRTSRICHLRKAFEHCYPRKGRTIRTSKCEEMLKTFYLATIFRLDSYCGPHCKEKN